MNQPLESYQDEIYFNGRRRHADSSRAVLIARPYAYALGLAGEEGVVHVLKALRQDFELTMRSAGYACLAALTRDCLARVP